MKEEINKIIRHIYNVKGTDLNIFEPSFLRGRIKKRMGNTSTLNFENYLGLLKTDSQEADRLVDLLFIKHSQFFRNSLTFEILENIVLPQIVNDKINRKEKHIRIWSAGCADGQEPYSLAMLINEVCLSEKYEFVVDIFGTDLSRAALQCAKKGWYFSENMDHVKYFYLNKYFIKKQDRFEICKQIKDLVNFSLYDLLEKKTIAPPACIYAGFDLIMCGNLLMYYNETTQKFILNKLYRALNNRGWLVVGESEASAVKNFGHFNTFNRAGRIYSKD